MARDSAKSSPAGQLLGLYERLTYASLYDSLDNWHRNNVEESKTAETINADFATADQAENRRELPKLLVLATARLVGRQKNYPYFFTRFDELRSARPEQANGERRSKGLVRALANVRSGHRVTSAFHHCGH